MLVDSHCHLDYLAQDGDLDDVVDRARRAGIGRMLTICTKISEFNLVTDIAATYDDVWCSVGIHPHNVATEEPVTAEALIDLARGSRVAGIGETGLDYFYDNSPREDQRRSFRAHIAAARETELPLIVHTRDADEDTAGILEDEYAKGAFRGVIHCFSTGRQLAERAVKIGFYISLSGILTFKKADELRDTVRALPIERLLVETDAPYLTPTPNRGKRNEPAYVVHTAARLAALKDLAPEALAKTTTDNFFALFKTIEHPSSS